MSSWKLVKLNFGRSPAHFGEVGIGIEETAEKVPSDSLFSAWITAYSRLFGKNAVEQLLMQFPRDRVPNLEPPFRLSSTFVYRHSEGSDIYYLPRPLKFPTCYPEEEDLKFFKTYKKLRYLPLEVWERWYQRRGFCDRDKEELIAETNKKESKTLLRQAGTFDYKKAFKVSQEPKIAVDRITRATNLYHSGFVQFDWGVNGQDLKSLSGLYFLLYFPKSDRELENNLHAALQLLGEEGIGGERSSGAGRFEVNWLPLPKLWQTVVDFKQGNYYSLMSLLWENDPSKLKLLITDECSYEIQERGGWISGQNLRRKMVRMFAEGSVFPSFPSGKLADVTPSDLIRENGEYKLHPIYRSGIGLSLPICTGK